MAASERIHRQRPTQTHHDSTQSISVPSTPHQHARDVRFPSRSPSPERILLSRVPTLPAIASKASRPYPERTAPVVCKFETGAEFRKRRIPYKDGGNESLPPPAKEPKRALQPHEEDKLSGDMRELYDRLLPTPESDERRVKLVEKLERILNEEWPGNDIKVNVFGSSGNLLSSSDSDVDICITTTLKKLESMHGLAILLHRHGMERVVCRAAAKVPIVKAWDPELQLACDMNVNNTLALENTRMIKTYVQIDDRVRPLAKIIKYWTKQRILNDAAFGGTISSYTWICMIINFLQTQKPPILPSLQLADASLRSRINGAESQFADDLDKLRGTGIQNKDSLGSLLFHFFRYYAFEIDYQKSVVSVKEGRVLSRKEKGWDPSNYQDKEARSRLCVEEPFNTNRNLGNSADDYAFSGIHEEIRRAFGLISQGKLDECCAEYVFPPEEKPLFQRPAPKPKPTLTRSASQSGQSGRSHASSVGAKSSGTPRTSRASSSNRASSRRASSGATFGNQRYGFMSPPFGIPGPDYLSGMKPVPNDQLHEQLYQQYQFLQAQQELLRSQLLQQQQTHAQLQAQAQAQAQAQSQAQMLRTSDFSAASPRRSTFVQGMPSPRLLEAAPLLPGYLYHYPARHPVPPGPGQVRLAEGSVTGPSSPSASMMPSQRRGVHRASIPEGASPASIRSQSQPGRSFPSPVALQSIAHPGYDVSGAIGTPFLTQQHLQMMQAQQSTYEAMARANVNPQQPFDTAIPKEYVGYYMGQSPQAVPQMPMNLQRAPVLRDTSSAQQQYPSELPLVMPNGVAQRMSRSPPRHGRRRSTSLTTTATAKSAPLPQGPFTTVTKSNANGSNVAQGSRAAPPTVPGIANGSGVGTSLTTSTADNPVIVDPQGTVDVTQENGDGSGSPGSHTSVVPKPYQSQAQADTLLARSPTGSDARKRLGRGNATSNEQSRSNDNHAPGGTNLTPDAGRSPSGSVSPVTKARPPALKTAPPRLPLDDDGISPFTTTSAAAVQTSGGTTSTQQSPPHPAPLLSPVAELQTPSPTSSRGQNSPMHRISSANDSAAIRAAAVAAIAAKSGQMGNGRPSERASGAVPNGAVSAWSNPLPLLGSAAPSPKPATSPPAVNGRKENGSSKGTPGQTSFQTPGSTRQGLATEAPSSQGQQTNTAATAASGEWQQAIRKHKKGRSLGSASAIGNAAGNLRDLPLRSGEALPARESERKGG